MSRASTDGTAPPGPRGEWLFGHAREMRADGLGAFRDYFATYGDVVALRMGPQRCVLVVHPDGVRHVLQKRHAAYDKRLFSYRRLKALLGEGLVTSDGALWRQERRIAQPAFHRERIARLDDVAVPAAERIATGWRAAAARGEIVDVHADMLRVTLEVAARALFGAGVDLDTGRFGAALGVAMNETLKRVYSPLPLPEWLPTPANRRLRRAKAEMAGAIDGIIASRERHPAGRDDLLDRLLEARDDPKIGLAPRHLGDMVTTMLLAGHETTANALSWTWFLLARHPDAVARLHDELARVLGGRAPTMADLPRLVYTRMVIEEAIRLLPPVWVLDRRAAEDDVIGGFRVEAGTMVILAPWLTHRHPEFWPDPDAFDPERFRPEAVAARHPFAYFPFAAGPRGCIGEHFALVETVLVLATLAQRFDLALLPDRWPVPEPSITLRPQDGLSMRIRDIERSESPRAAS